VSSSEHLRSLVEGYRVTQAVHVAAELGISDALASGPLDGTALADRVGADPDTLRRLMGALVTVGVYDEAADGCYANGEVAELLRSDVPGSLRAWARNFGEPEGWAAWGQLLHSVRTGETAFDATHGSDVWTYRGARPEWNAVFNDAMTANTTGVAAAVADAYDFSGHRRVVDVGGGQGLLLEAVLKRHPHLEGIVFDLAHAVASAPTSRFPTEAHGRWGSASGSFFEELPPADAYLLKSVLHDWPDDDCVRILRTCREAMDTDGVVLLVEVVLGRPEHARTAAFSDLNMLVMTGGRERTADEYAELFSRAELRLTRVVDTATRVSVVEAVRR
jgi:hypothetical protein